MYEYEEMKGYAFGYYCGYQRRSLKILGYNCIRWDIKDELQDKSKDKIWRSMCILGISFIPGKMLFHLQTDLLPCPSKISKISL